MAIEKTERIPSTREAFEFFAQYRRQVDEKERNEGKAHEIQILNNEIHNIEMQLLTQAKEEVEEIAKEGKERHLNKRNSCKNLHSEHIYDITMQEDGLSPPIPSSAIVKVEERVETIIETSFIPVDKTKGTASFRLRTLKRSPKNQSPVFPSEPRSLLPPPTLLARKRVTLVLDVDETLVHSSFSPQPGVHYDNELVVTYDQKLYTIYVRYRPYLHDFLKFVSERFEIVIFTASLGAYCDPLMDLIDQDGMLGTLRLFREHCTQRNNSYIKDLFLLGRELGRIAIIDNSPTAYLFQQRNAIPIKSWFGDPNDEELLNLYTLLGKLANCESVYDILDEYNANGIVREHLKTSEEHEYEEQEV